MLKIKEFINAEYIFKKAPNGVWVDTAKRTIGLIADHDGEIDNEDFNFIYDLIKMDFLEKVDDKNAKNQR